MADHNERISLTLMNLTQMPGTAVSFALRPVGFVNDLIAAVNAIRSELLGAVLPSKLFHYTSAEAVVGIIESRHLRATCAADLADQTEIRHGCDLMADEIRRLIRLGVEPFAAAVLNKVPEHIRARIERTFVACFCGQQNSLYHWNLLKRWGYGDFCLRFETNAAHEPLLRPSLSDAYVQYHRVIYGRSKQKRAISTALGATVQALERHSGGVPDGPWINSLADFAARNVTELLLDVIVSFKRQRYLFDREWRIVVRPNAALCSSAPAMAEANFDVLVKRASKRYVELYVPVATSPFLPLLRPPVPFSGIIRSPFSQREGALSIRHALDANGRQSLNIAEPRW